MASKMYEARVYKDGRELRGEDPWLTTVDFDDGERTADKLDRHLLGAALRSGAHRTEVHRFHLEFRDIDGEGKGHGRVLFRWVPPAAEGV